MSLKVVAVSLLSVGITCSAVTVGYIYLKKDSFGTSHEGATGGSKGSLSNVAFLPTPAKDTSEPKGIANAPVVDAEEKQPEEKETYKHDNKCTFFSWYHCVF